MSSSSILQARNWKRAHLGKATSLLKVVGEVLLVLLIELIQRLAEAGSEGQLNGSETSGQGEGQGSPGPGAHLWLPPSCHPKSWGGPHSCLRVIFPLCLKLHAFWKQ